MASGNKQPFAVRALLGFSLAALAKLICGDPAAARRVIGATLAASKNSQVPTLDVIDVARAFPVDEQIELYGASWTLGSTTPLERFLMATLLRHFRPQRILEIGTYRGTTTRVILDNCPDAAQVFTVDLPPNVDAQQIQAATDKNLIQNRLLGIDFADHPRRSQVIQILGDTMNPNTWEQIPTGIQFAFIDGSHSYDAVRNDTERLWPKLSSDAVVLWHDYYPESTTQPGEPYGVGRYLRERMRREKDTFVCGHTAMAVRIPLPILASGLKRIASWFPPGEYDRLFPGGPAYWL